MVNNPSASAKAVSAAKAKVAELQRRLQQGQANLNQFREKAQQLAQQGQQEQLAPLQVKAVEAVKAIAENQGIDLVFPLDSLIYGTNDLEVTDAVIGYLN